MRVSMATTLFLSFGFFCNAHSGAKLKITSSLIFLKMFFIQYFTILVANRHNVITFLICIIENINISKTKKDIPRRETPFFFSLKSLSNKQQLFFTS